jgi:AcrR family transcriptional regulator
MRTRSDVVQQPTVDAGLNDHTSSAESETMTRSGKKERTRARLLEAAEAVFGLRGFNDASIVEITQRAGVALGTFYVYFPSKTSIFNFIIETSIADLRDRLRSAREEAKTPIEQHRAVLRGFMQWAVEHPNAYRAARQADYVEGTSLRNWYAMFVDDYAGGLGRAMDAGTVTRTNPEVLAWSLVGMADLLATHWITWTNDSAAGIPPDQLDAFLDIAMRTLGVGVAEAG